MMRKTAMMVAILAMAAAAAQANIAYTPDIGLDPTGIGSSAENAAGVPLAHGTYLLVLDLNNNGSQDAFTKTGGSATSWLWDSGDLILDRGDIGAAYGPGIAFPSANINPASYAPNFSTSDHVYMLWFDTAYNAAATGPGAGVHYGVEDLGTTPADGGTLTTDAVGGAATFVTAPEPATLVLLAVGGAISLIRRRNRTHA
jgi:hypothetical protein